MKDSKSMPHFPGTVEMVQLEQGTRFQLNSEKGQMVMTRYSVFPGIDLIYNDVHMDQFTADMQRVKENVIEIDHCREGRLECQVDEDYFYLAPGDISIHRLGAHVREEFYPTSHYHGITIQIDLEKLPPSLNSFLEGVDVEPAALIKKFHLDENFFFALRQQPSIEHLFSELYTVPKSQRKGYFKVKILEIFLFLNGLEPELTQKEQRALNGGQVELAKAVCRYLMEHLEQHITISHLAEQFRVSQTQIKNSFRGVYGMPISSYVRGQRMQAAAKILKESNRTVLDVANQFGYDNGSKFAAAFREVLGVTPAQYRKESLYQKEDAPL